MIKPEASFEKIYCYKLVPHNLLTCFIMLTGDEEVYGSARGKKKAYQEFIGSQHG